MTAEAKAIRLFTIMYGEFENGISHKEAKRCALISVEFAREFITGDLSERFDKTMYLLEVKQEIEKL